MPAAIVAGSLFLILICAFWLSSWYILQDVDDRLAEVKAPISNFPVVGGWIAAAIGIVQDQIWILRGIAIANYQNTVNWASGGISDMIARVVDNTTWSQIWTYSHWTRGLADNATSAISGWILGNINALWDEFHAVYGIAQDASNTAHYAADSINGWINSSINELWNTLNWIVGVASEAHQWAGDARIALATWVPGRLDNLERWREQEQTQVLPRIQADINSRARSIDVDALQQRIIALERAVALLLALGIIAAEGTQVIENLRCISKINCNDLSGLVDCDVCDRLDSLELGAA